MKDFVGLFSFSILRWGHACLWVACCQLISWKNNKYPTEHFLTMRHRFTHFLFNVHEEHGYKQVSCSRLSNIILVIISACAYFSRSSSTHSKQPPLHRLWSKPSILRIILLQQPVEIKKYLKRMIWKVHTIDALTFYFNLKLFTYFMQITWTSYFTYFC